MNFFRWMLGLPLAAAVTLGLFIVMVGLIAQDSRTDPPKDTKEINILAKFVEPKPTPPPPPRHDLQDAPPPPERVWIERTGPVKPGQLPGPGPVVIPTDPPRGAATPIIRFPPPYPEGCRSRAAEGAVLVQFDVTDRGEVTNVRILSSDNSCFDRTVIKTVMSWKYPPEARRGLVQTFVFSLNDG